MCDPLSILKKVTLHLYKIWGPITKTQERNGHEAAGSKNMSRAEDYWRCW
jgi:hypothetical protein